MLINGRLVDTAVYSPAGETANGKKYDSNTSIRVAVNFFSSKKDGVKGAIYVKVTFWGVFGDLIAKNFQKGDMICCEGDREPNYTYQKRNKEGVPLTDNDGEQVMLSIESYRGTKIYFQDEPYRVVKRSLACGERRIGWDEEGHPAKAEFEEFKAKKAEAKYIPGEAKFWYADVRGVKSKTGYGQTTGLSPEEMEVIAAIRKKKADEAAAATNAANKESESSTSFESTTNGDDEPF